MLAPIRLSLRPVGGQGQPYDDDVVAIARSLMETSDLTQRAVAARVGVSAMTISRWSRAGKWRPPRRRRFDASRRGWAAFERASLVPDPWGWLEEAERLLGRLERTDRASLDEIERALSLLLSARRDFFRPQSKRRKRRAGPT